MTVKLTIPVVLELHVPHHPIVIEHAAGSVDIGFLPKDAIEVIAAEWADAFMECAAARKKNLFSPPEPQDAP